MQVRQAFNASRSLWREVRRSLSFKLGLTVGLIFLVAFLVFTFYLLSVQKQQAFQRMISSALQFSDTVKRGTHYSMLKNQRDGLHKIIEAIGAQPGVEKIRVFNKHGAIMFSSHAPEIGTYVDMQAEACYGCHQRDRPLERLRMQDRSRIYHSEAGYRVLGVVNPIYNEPSCWQAACHYHPKTQKVLGVLDVGLSLAELDREIAADRWRVITFAVALFLGVSAFMSGCVLAFVNRPIRRLVAATRQLAAGDYSSEIPALTDDEIGDLARAFEEMRRDIYHNTRALERSKREYQALFEQVPCQMSVQDREFRIIRVNRMFAERFGDQLGQFCYRAYKGRESKCPVCPVEQTFADGRSHSSEEVAVKKDGTQAFMLVSTAPIYNDAGEVVAALEMSTDVTEVRHLEQELRRSEEKYRTLFNSDPNPIFVLDLHSLEILDANDRALEDYGYQREELLGKSFVDLAHPEDRQRLRQLNWTQKGTVYRLRHRTKDGRVLVVSLSYSPCKHLGREAIIATSADVTERVKKEEQLVQAGKMATLGEMSAGVAHELNQPLSVIKTAASFLKRKIANEEPVAPEILRTLAEEMDAQVDRAAQIITHLRQFGRRSDGRSVAVQINDCIRGAFTVLGRQLQVHGIKVELDLDENLPPVLGDRTMLEQVFLNLIMNARDAMDEKEAAAKGERVRKVLRIRSYRQDDEVVVVVADTGVGMSPEVQEKIFDPFFTTKPVGKGTGLGLAISYGIVRDYEGSIEVESVASQGTIFRIRFPVAPAVEPPMEVAGG